MKCSCVNTVEMESHLRVETVRVNNSQMLMMRCWWTVSTELAICSDGNEINYASIVCDSKMVKVGA